MAQGGGPAGGGPNCSLGKPARCACALRCRRRPGRAAAQTCAPPSSSRDTAAPRGGGPNLTEAPRPAPPSPREPLTQAQLRLAGGAAGSLGPGPRSCRRRLPGVGPKLQNVPIQRNHVKSKAPSPRPRRSRAPRDPRRNRQSWACGREPAIRLHPTAPRGGPRAETTRLRQGLRAPAGRPGCGDTTLGACTQRGDRPLQFVSRENVSRRWKSSRHYVFYNAACQTLQCDPDFTWEKEKHMCEPGKMFGIEAKITSQR